MMTEDKRTNTEVNGTSDQIYAGFKQKQSPYGNILKNINALQLKLYQNDKHLQFIREENCLIRNLLDEQITSLLEDIREKDSMIQKLQNVKKEHTLNGLTVKLDTVIGEISGMCSAVNELLVEVRRKRSQSDTKNITLNIKQKGILNISTEE
ncbi:unnamed protein product [Mytilus edulis]|uniref:Uncharacterized protein n=1 Tax=Mytilus edulis TaxID=6550 RepID=A0A8S3VAC2_MYTED|nr:unnamed protein product [Mytilus edulis]